ncbi:MAG: hypothetical protein AAF368_04095, partial [Planctomycetota bacterium]
MEALTPLEVRTMLEVEAPLTLAKPTGQALEFGATERTPVQAHVSPELEAKRNERQRETVRKLLAPQGT